MKISLNWLSDFVDLTVTDPVEISRRVTAGVAEVDDLEVQGALLDRCVVGKVTTVRKHPGADRLSLCEVQTDEGPKPVVCGGTNLRPGMRVAFAHVGARVRWHGDGMVTLTRAKIRGEDSQGMICAAEELDLASLFPAKPEDGERPIVDLGDGDDGVGAPLREYLGLRDVVLHIDNHAITHRADLFSHVGFAREFVALGLATWKKTKKQSVVKYGKEPLPFEFVIERKDLIPHYCAVAIAIDGPGETPAWMKERLAATGWRSINLPIDITNYVATEQGMPLHAFDAADIRGAVHARTAEQGETIVTLDKEKRALPKGAIVMNDDEGIFDLLGIMGGLRSSTKDSTRLVYLHAAIADPSAIRRTVIATGHRTDAATVYEKGIPREAALRGLERAVTLFLELVPGAKVVSKLETVGPVDKEKTIELPLSLAERILGTAIGAKEATNALEDLGFDVKAKKGKEPTLEVTVPAFRLGDIRTGHDLVEEIGRVVGYDAVAPVLPAASIRPAKRETRVHSVRDELRLLGYSEIVPLSLTSAATLKKAGFDPHQAIAIQNPLSEEWAVLHTSTVPALLEHAQRNVLLAGPVLRTFHVANVFRKGEAEKTELSLLFADLAATDVSVKEEPLLLAKRHVSQVLSRLGLSADVSTGGKAPSSAHPGRAAELFAHPRRRPGEAETASRPIGWIYEVHPEIRKAFDLRGRAAVATLDVTALLELPADATAAIAPVPQFPSVTYDVTLALSHREQSGPMLRQLRHADPLLESVDVVDLYSGKPMEKGQFTLTLRFTYRASDRTLTEDEAKKAHDKVLKQASL